MQSVDLIGDSLQKSTEHVMVRVLMFGEPNPLVAWGERFDGAAVSADSGQHSPFVHVLAKCRELRAPTVTLLESLAADDFHRVSANTPGGHEDVFATRRLCLQYVADHWSTHRGRLADARRAAGVDRMWLEGWAARSKIKMRDPTPRGRVRGMIRLRQAVLAAQAAEQDRAGDTATAGKHEVPARRAPAEGLIVCGGANT